MDFPCGLNVPIIYPERELSSLLVLIVAIFVLMYFPFPCDLNKERERGRCGTLAGSLSSWGLHVCCEILALDVKMNGLNTDARGFGVAVNQWQSGLPLPTAPSRDTWLPVVGNASSGLRQMPLSSSRSTSNILSTLNWLSCDSLCSNLRPHVSRSEPVPLPWPNTSLKLSSPCKNKFQEHIYKINYTFHLHSNIA